MASKSVLREFLTVLGFKVDEAGAKKFVGALGSTAKVAAQTSGAVVGAAAAIEAYVQLFAASMEKIYYSSKRTGASIENIQALEFAAKQVGISAEDARGALEAMASAVRLNPGLKGLLGNLVGYSTEGKEQSKVLTDLVGKLNQMPHFIGARLGGMFGLDEKMLLMLRDGGLEKLIKSEEERRKMARAAGVDIEKAGEASVSYSNKLDHLWEQVKILGAQLAIALLPHLEHYVKVIDDLIFRFTIWIGKNKELLQSRLDQFLKGLVEWIEKIDFDELFKNLESFVKSIDRIVRALGGWENAGYLAAAVIAGPLILAIVNLGIAITTLMANPAVAAFSALVATLGPVGVLALAGKRYSEVKGTNADPFPEKGEGGQHTPSRDVGGGIRAAPSVGSLNQSTLDYAHSVGSFMGDKRKLNKEQILALLLEEKGRPDRNKDWDSELDREIARVSGGIPPTGTGARVASGGAGESGGSGANVVLNQETNINVAGGGAAGEVVRGVIQGQRGVNADIVRNFRALYN